MNMDIKDFEWYIVFMDSKENYVMAYGYSDRPAIIDMKYAFDALAKEDDLAVAIPDFHNIMDYVCVDVMSHKKFMKYMVDQEAKMKKLETKKEKKKKVKNETDQ